MSRPKKIIILAGPNGAGKTTFAREFLPGEANCPIFINADLIAAGLAPFAPETVSITAGKLMLKMIDQHVENGESFAFETTLSAKIYAGKIKKWRLLGYHVKLVFIELPNVEQAIARVRQRVIQGGHDIPIETIERRFDAGLRHFHLVYKPIVDAWLHFDGAAENPVLIYWSEKA